MNQKLTEYADGEEARKAANGLLGAMNGFYSLLGKVAEPFFDGYDNARAQVIEFGGNTRGLDKTEDLRIKFNGGFN